MNSVKYPQLDATHWHTVSMQILFTLGSPPPTLLLSLSPYIYIYISRSLPFTITIHVESLSALSSFALLFHPQPLVESDAMRATHVCTHIPPVLPIHHISHLATKPRRSTLYLYRFRDSHLRVINISRRNRCLQIFFKNLQLSYVLFTLHFLQ